MASPTAKRPKTKTTEDILKEKIENRRALRTKLREAQKVVEELQVEFEKAQKEEEKARKVHDAFKKLSQ